MIKTFLKGVWEGVTSRPSKQEVALLGFAAASLAISGASEAIGNAVVNSFSGPAREGASPGCAASGGSAKAGVLSHLDSGQSVVGTPFDSLKPLSSFSDASAKRYGYMGNDGYWTERGYNRATSADWDQFQNAHDAFKQSEDD